MPAPRTAPSKSSPSPRILTEKDGHAIKESLRELIRQRAHNIFEQSGWLHGQADAHWLEAEAQLLQNLQVSESGNWIAINASLSKESGKDVQIVVEPTRVIIRAGKRRQAETSTGTWQEEEVAFFASELPAEVDPSTATASVKNQKLTMMVEKKSTKESPKDSAAATNVSVSS
jgi:HSP20 family molecular chaperone IbpA